MAAIPKPPKSFVVTPHKLSICILVQVYSPPSQISIIPFPFSSVSQHNRLGIFLISLTKVNPLRNYNLCSNMLIMKRVTEAILSWDMQECGGIFEPTLVELTAQLKEIGGLLNHWLSDHLMRRLSSLASPDDLFNFFADLRGNSWVILLLDNCFAMRIWVGRANFGAHCAHMLYFH